MKIILNRLCFLVLLSFSLTTLAKDPQTQLIPVEDFAKLPSFENPQLSPDGKRIAVTLLYNDAHILIVQKLKRPHDKEKETPVIISSGEYFFNWYKWANDDRIIISIRASSYLEGNILNVTRLSSFSRHKGEEPVMFNMTPNADGIYRQQANVISWLDNDPEYILAALDDSGQWAMPHIDKVNVYTGDKTRYFSNSMGFFDFLADKAGNVRIAIKVDTKNNRRGITLYYRETEKDSWEILQKTDYFDNDRLSPARFDEDDPNILLLTSSNMDESTSLDESEIQLFRYNLTQRKILGPYKNVRRKKIIETVEKALPETKVNIVSHDKAKQLYMFRAYSDVHPPEYYLLDLKRKSLDFIASEYPELAKVKLAKMKKVSYQARDGLTIPAFLTLPDGSDEKNLPVIILPHGGPWAEDEWGFNNYVQFFASRGYAVLQPQFRGSTGHGLRHLEAGYGQWGMGIQNDITDGVHWLIKEKIADPKRICIIGSSFGGYAAVTGAAKTPDIYCCAVSINGVLDLKKYISDGQMMLFEGINRAVWNKYSDAEENSPYHLAENIKAPLLLIASEKDTVVPLEHSKKMYKRMLKLKKKVEYVELPGGEHWRTTNSNEQIKLKAIEKFLTKYMEAHK